MFLTQEMNVYKQCSIVEEIRCFHVIESSNFEISSIKVSNIPVADATKTRFGPIMQSCADVHLKEDVCKRRRTPG